MAFHVFPGGGEEERQYGLTTGESAQNVDPNSEQYQAQDSPGGKKKSVIGKVKDKAKKLKAKIKPKKGSSGDGESGGSEDEEEGDQSPPSSGTQQSDHLDENKDREVKDGSGVQDKLADRDVKDIGGVQEETMPDQDVPAAGYNSANQDEKFEAAPNANVPATDDVQERLGELKLEPKTHEMPQEDVPAVADAAPAERGGEGEGRDLTSYQGEQDLSTDQSNIAGAAGTLGIAEAASAEPDQGSQNEQKKSMLQQAHEKIFGSQPATTEAQEGQPKPTIASRAADTVFGLKDALASKIGYGSSSPTPGSSPTSAQPEESGPEETNPASKSYVQRAQEIAMGGKDAVLTKLGYGSAPGEGETDQEQQQKSYLQKIQETAYVAKDAVASKLGYNAGQNDASEHDENAAPTRFHPGEEDKALSQIITDAMSNSAATVKNTVLNSFGGSNAAASPPPSTGPPPSEPSDVAT